MAGKIVHESVIEEADLHEVLANGTGLDVILISLGDAAKEVHRIGIAEVIVQGGQDVSFGVEDLGLSESIIGNVSEVGNVRGENLFVLGRNEHGSNTDKLQTVELNNLGREETINDVHRKEESLRQKVETRMDFDQPVNENATHLPLEIVLVRHIIGVRSRRDLQVTQVLEDLDNVLGDHQRIVQVLSIKVINVIGDGFDQHGVCLLKARFTVLGLDVAHSLLGLNMNLLSQWLLVVGRCFFLDRK